MVLIILMCVVLASCVFLTEGGAEGEKEAFFLQEDERRKGEGKWRRVLQFCVRVIKGVNECVCLCLCVCDSSIEHAGHT